jgi:RNA polymerase sigma factor (sigma-70 family)
MSSDDSVQSDGDTPAANLERPAGADPRTESDRLFREHNHALLSYAYAQVRSWADAKDVVQEAYVKVFDLGNDRPISHLRAYLYKAVRSCATDWIRRRNVRENFTDLEYFRVDKESVSVEEIWICRDQIQQALDSLPPKCRLAMILVNVQGLSCEEAAKHMRIKTQSVRRLLERAVDYVVEIMQAKSGGSAQ